MGKLNGGNIYAKFTRCIRLFLHKRLSDRQTADERIIILVPYTALLL